ncbi:translocation/assembly module TamB domain-containing protein [Desertivirga xinjiangensis]|uniref:translocation/assembly module TamB domain-containing protein n=1 Tax=Desertivirga xinjiangensis TaxID=539206 RepID=UPI002109BC31|nr:translocation/assembly module TamB [Pedobacter xinjiangensis]
MAAAFIFSLQLKPVQTYIAKKAARYLSDELHTTIEIKSLYIKPFKSLVLEGLYVQDLDKDTLLYSPEFAVDLNVFNIKQKRIGISSLQLDSGKFYLKSYKQGGTNLQFIVDYFTPKSPAPKVKKKPFNITIDKVVLNHISFKYRNFNRNNALQRINFDDLDLNNLSTTIQNVDTKNHLFKARINQLQFKEKSGFTLNNLSTDAIIDTNKMEFKNLLLETPRSSLSNYLLLKYSKFSDFKQFTSKVYVKLNLKRSKLHSKDISFFADATRKMNLDIRLDGTVSGYLRDIKARNFSARAGQATYLKGNFDIKGLPAINQTRMDLRFEQLHSNKKDVEFLARAITGKSQKIPPIAEKFGNISFKGNFKGLVKDFSARGELKTALGRVYSDLNMNLQGTPTYSGIVKAYDFNLRELLDRKDLGRATLSAQIKGRGFSFKDLNEEIKAEAAYVDFRGYRYSNISINGSFHESIFLGQVDIKDRNIHLDFDGSINIRKQTPEYNFVASLKNTRLHKLGFTKDTIQLDADLRTNFTGNNLNNIQGHFEINRIRLSRPENSIVVDSVYLTASGVGTSRSLTIKSDILDASLLGNYDLATLPSYFKSVVNQYLPSLKLKTVPFGAQDFEFSLKVKYFEPIALFLLPELKVPEGAVFNGRFISAENTATLNGSSPLIEFKKIRINNLIIDESTSPSALNLFLTADRVDITDKLYIQNINIANILQNDSLSLNVKLSDKDATNQLDLNGLVEFATDTAARLSVLPSDVVINHEIWRIQEQVKFKFDQGKVFIENFELFRDNQLLTLDGVISPDPKDILYANFKQFKLATFNPVTSSAGISLSGELNGALAISSITKKTKMESDIKIDSLTMNNTTIGDVMLTANLDNETKLVDVEMNILKQGIETLFASGTYNANSVSNKLDIDLVMNNGEVIIFQPFIKNLVSNLSGNVSAQLKLTGTPLNPKINGGASLINTGLTINYLKTPYRINDDVTVDNSVIKLNDLELTDIYGNKATASGSVDMTNPKVPEIDVTLRATRFLALNTTAKDNPVYYGTAFGTGTFRFRGPTNNMRIDINAKTEEGTVFNIPLNASERIGNSNFITFVAKDSSITPTRLPTFSGLVMNFDLKVDEASQVNIITDLGKLNGRGTAEQLSLKITSAGDFEMRGDYLISSGKFVFTAQDYINKEFDISQGGSIRWTGDPADAQINLKAVYGVRTSLRDLYIAAGRNAEQQSIQQVEAIINLSGKLTQPDIVFDINFPADTYIKDDLQNYFSNQDNKNTQAISLIVRRTFTANTGLSSAATQTITSAGSELIFNQLNSIIAQSLNLKTVDINFRSLNDFGLSGRFFNNRLILTGGLSDRRVTGNDLNDFNVLGGNAIARDIEASYLIKKDGSLTARVSNKLNNRSVLTLAQNQEDYVNAIGLVYRKDFDTFGEFLRALINRQRRHERRRSDDPPLSPGIPTTTPTPTAPTPPPPNRESGR